MNLDLVAKMTFTVGGRTACVKTSLHWMIHLIKELSGKHCTKWHKGIQVGSVGQSVSQSVAFTHAVASSDPKGQRAVRNHIFHKLTLITSL